MASNVRGNDVAIQVGQSSIARAETGFTHGWRQCIQEMSIEEQGPVLLLNPGPPTGMGHRLRDVFVVLLLVDFLEFILAAGDDVEIA